MATKTPILRSKQSDNGEWFFTLISTNGKKVFTGGELFKSKMTEKRKQRLLWLLENAVIEYVPLKKEKYVTKKSAKRVR